MLCKTNKTECDLLLWSMKSWSMKSYHVTQLRNPTEITTALISFKVSPDFCIELYYDAIITLFFNNTYLKNYTLLCIA